MSGGKHSTRVSGTGRLQVTERDLAVLEALGSHRFLSAEQLQRLVLRCGLSRARRRLRALFDHGFVSRVSLDGLVSASLPAFVYELSAKGVAALREIEVPVSPSSLGKDGLRLVRHKYLVNDFYITAREATQGTPYAIANWRHEQELKVPSADGLGRIPKVAVKDPVSGAVAEVPFLPDAFFELTCPGGRSLAFFVEVDLATHALSVWRKRAHLYLAFHDPRRRLFRERFGREAFRLLIVTTNDYRGRSRCENIVRTIHQAVGSSNLFLATTLSNVTRGRLLFENVWRQPGGSGLLALVSREGTSIASVGSGGRVRVRPGK